MKEQNCCCREKIIFVFAAIFVIFLISATVYTVAGAINKIKEGKYIGREIEAGKTISITDKGEIYAKPDLAMIDFSVVSDEKTVAEAIADNTKKMNAIIKAIKEQGVDEKDLKTTYFNLYPRYEYQKEEIEIYPYPPGKRVLVGYEVSQTLEVKIRDLSKIGVVIEKATEKGANEVGSLQMAIEKQDELKDQARQQAIEKAKAKAKNLASQLGVKLVKISNFSENAEYPYFYNYAETAKGMGVGGGAPAADIQTGQNKITVIVTITYEIE